MIEIPLQLRNKDFRFIKIAMDGISARKRPLEQDWQNTNNYTYNSNDLIIWLINDNNYGIVCGKGNLAIIDCDKPEIAEIVEKYLPKTFVVKTGSGGKHYYYIVRDMNKTIVLQKPIKNENNKIVDKEHCGEIRSTGSQVVAPNSLHPTGNKYEVYNNYNIAEVHKDTIDILFKDYINIEKEDDDKYNNKQNNYKKFNNVGIQKVVDISKFKKNNSEYQGPHPIHGSTTGTNFSVNAEENLWHCFRCNTGGGIVTLIAMLNGIILCSNAKSGCVTPTIFEEVKKIAKEKYNMELKYGDE